MAINKKYSHNGYDPKSSEIITLKADMRSKFDSGEWDRKRYSEECTKMKIGFKYNDLTGVGSVEFNNSEIIGSSFSQREPYTDVFPVGMTGVTFINCNLDNCKIPVGNTVSGGTNKHFRIQNDRELWIVDDKIEPIVPLDEVTFDRCKISKDPRDISVSLLSKPITVTSDPALIEKKLIDEILSDEERLKAALIAAGELSAPPIETEK